MRHGNWLSLALIVAASEAGAQGCVSGIEVVTSRGDLYPVAEVAYVNLYPSIESCNKSMAEVSRNPLSHGLPEGTAPFASFTFECRLPAGCSAPDEGRLQLFHKVLIWAK